MTHYIAIEGIDGAGKATQAASLAQRLRDSGLTTAVFSFPVYETVYGKMIAAYLRGEYGSLEATSPDIIAPLYTLNRVECREAIGKAAGENKFIVFDRWYGSNMAHQGAKIKDDDKRQEFYADMLVLERDLLWAKKPNITFFLDIDVDTSTANVATKDARDYTKSTHDLHESNAAYLADVRSAYREVAASDGWLTVACMTSGKMRTPDDISNEIFTRTLAVIGVKNAW